MRLVDASSWSGRTCCSGGSFDKSTNFDILKDVDATGGQVNVEAVREVERLGGRVLRALRLGQHPGVSPGRDSGPVAREATVPRRPVRMSATLEPVACCAPLGAPTLNEDEADGTAELFKALGDPARVKIVNLIATAARRRLRLRLQRRARARPADRHPSPEEADGSRPARARAARQVGLFLAEARGGREARGRRRSERSVLLMTTTAEELRDEVRRRYAESARAVRPKAAAVAAAVSAAPKLEMTGRASSRRSTTPSSAASSRRRRHSHRSAAATRPRSPSYTRARLCSTSGPAAEST